MHNLAWWKSVGATARSEWCVGTGGQQGRTREMLDEKATIENITYKNGKVYSKKDHQKAIETLQRDE